MHFICILKYALKIYIHIYSIIIYFVTFIFLLNGGEKIHNFPTEVYVHPIKMFRTLATMRNTK